MPSEQDPPVERGRPDDEDSGSGKHRRDAERSEAPPPYPLRPYEPPPLPYEQPPPFEPPPPGVPSPFEPPPPGVPSPFAAPPPFGEQPPAPPSSGGTIRFQDPATTQPRPPTVGEARARDKAAQKQQEIEEARLAAQAKRSKRNRRLIGGTAAVGLVGLVAPLGYWALSPRRVTAQCVRDDRISQPIIVQDNYCTGRTAGYDGFFSYGGHSYRYYYGSSGAIGSAPVGGSTFAPKGATITTRSGTTIQRGGLGSRFGGGS